MNRAQLQAIAAMQITSDSERAVLSELGVTSGGPQGMPGNMPPGGQQPVGTPPAGGPGGNGAFATGSGSSIALANVNIHATGAGGHGVMAT